VGHLAQRQSHLTQCRLTNTLRRSAKQRVVMPIERTLSDVQAFLPIAPREYLVLFALAEGPAHGYAILKAIESGSGSVPVDPANLYRSLRKLTRDRLVVEAAPVERDTAVVPRRLYRLTPLGRRVLGAEAKRLTGLVDAARARRLVSST
jgi:PadR family transcriptional regulator PadR